MLRWTSTITNTVYGATMTTENETGDLANIETLISAYVRIRNRIEEKEQEIKTLKEKQELVANGLLEICAEQNINSARTPAGTLSRTVRTTYWTSDWDEMYKFIAKHGALHLLEKRIHNSNMKEFLADKPDEVPIGLQADSKYVIQVRKPSAK